MINRRAIYPILVVLMGLYSCKDPDYIDIYERPDWLIGEGNRFEKGHVLGYYAYFPDSQVDIINCSFWCTNNIVVSSSLFCSI